MSSIALPANADTKTHPHLRPLSILRDLPAVADLIEMCFSNTLDSDGKRYVQDMRRAGNDNAFTQWANRAAETTSLPLTGYVWDENGKVVGNASLVPFRREKERVYLIANVAVHPDYRRRGIARALTERVMQHAREKKINNVWLHVREDNFGAIDLYTQLGFIERARRAAWQASTDAHVPTLKTDLVVANKPPRDWQTQLSWLSRLYPDFLAWHRNWNFDSLRPSFWNWLYLTFIDMNVRQWTAVKKNQSLANSESMEAALVWIPYERGEALFAAVGEKSDPSALTALLLHARRDLTHYHPSIVLEFPSSEFDGAIRAAGFKALRTLIWMQAT
jgi:ribosomal protein S18 acetylase RimI-like enzyme